MSKPVESLKPCPLCGGDAWDKGFGVSCRKCGLWLGEGTQADKLGGYLAIWNTRPAPDDGSFEKAVEILLVDLDDYIGSEASLPSDLLEKITDEIAEVECLLNLRKERGGLT